MNTGSLTRIVSLAKDTATALAVTPGGRLAVITTSCVLARAPFPNSIKGRSDEQIV